VLSPYSDGLLLWKVDGEEVSVFEHYIGDEKQPGTFLGGYNGTTTWAFKWYPANVGSSRQDYYTMRLMRPGVGLDANETMGFIKVSE